MSMEPLAGLTTSEAARRLETQGRNEILGLVLGLVPVTVLEVRKLVGRFSGRGAR